MKNPVSTSESKLVGRGGPGRGQGRKPVGAEPMKMYKIYLTPPDVERAEAIGDGNISAGVRLALKIAIKHAEPK